MLKFSNSKQSKESTSKSIKSKEVSLKRNKNKSKNRSKIGTSSNRKNSTILERSQDAASNLQKLQIQAVITPLIAEKQVNTVQNKKQVALDSRADNYTQLKDAGTTMTKFTPKSYMTKTVTKRDEL